MLPHPSKYKETYFANRKRTWSLALPVHSFLSHLHFFKVGEIMSKYGHLMLPGAFPDQVTPDTDFTDEAVLQCSDVPVVKILL